MQAHDFKCCGCMLASGIVDSVFDPFSAVVVFLETIISNHHHSNYSWPPFMEVSACRRANTPISCGWGYRCIGLSVRHRFETRGAGTMGSLRRRRRRVNKELSPSAVLPRQLWLDSRNSNSQGKYRHYSLQCVLLSHDMSSGIFIQY